VQWCHKIKHTLSTRDAGSHFEWQQEQLFNTIIGQYGKNGVFFSVSCDVHMDQPEFSPYTKAI